MSRKIAIETFNNPPIEPEELFGKDTKRLSVACIEIMHNSFGHQKRFSNEKLFKIVYGIARRHHLYLEWCGKGCACEPDRWEIYKKGKRIGRIETL